MESPEEIEAETEAEAGGGVEELDAAGGFAEREEDEDCAENGRGDDARALTVRLLLDGQAIEPAHSGALVEACPRARRGRGGGLLLADAKRCVDVDDDAAAAADDVVTISPRMFMEKGRETRFGSPQTRLRSVDEIERGALSAKKYRQKRN